MGLAAADSVSPRGLGAYNASLAEKDTMADTQRLDQTIEDLRARIESIRDSL
jgi:hypothetical protein